MTTHAPATPAAATPEATRSGPAPAAPRRPRRRWGPTVARAAEPVLAVLAVLAAAAALTPFFAGRGWALPVGLAAVAGGALAWLVTWRRVPAWALAPVGLVALVVGQLYGLHAGDTLYGLPRTDALRATAEGLLSGWARMLTVTLPADPSPDLLALPVALTFAAAYVAVLLVLRTRLVVTVALPALVVLVACLALTAGRDTWALVATVGMLAAALLLVLVRANRASTDDGASLADARAVGVDLAAERRHSTAGRVLIGLPGAALVVALAVLGTTALPLADGSGRADPRTAYSPPVQVDQGLSPLVQVRPQLTDPEVTLYRVRVRTDGDPADVTHVRLTALDRFDGALWTQGGRFVLAGSALPHSTTYAAGADTVHLDVEVLTGSSIFLPVVGEPVALAGVPAALDAAGGTLVRADDAAERSGATSYTVSGLVAHLDGVEEAGPPPGDAGLLALPDVPEWVGERADAARAAGVTPWAQLDALATSLAALDYDPLGLPGHSYGALERLLRTDDPEPGYAEQHASAFAVVARALGYPTRVAVGYRLDPTRAVDGVVEVRSTDVHAWPEVLLDGYGWVAFEPTDITNTVDSPRLDEPEVPQVAPDDTVAQPTQADDAADQAGSEVAGGLLGRVARTGAFVVAGIVLALLLVAGGVALAKHLRRTRRRTTGTPARRVAAAWRETCDVLREHGVPVALARTPLEVAATVRGTTGAAGAAAEAVSELAMLVTAAVCGPAEPSDATARRAWTLAADARRRAAARTPLPRRVLAAVDPRTLRGPRTRAGASDRATPPETGGDATPVPVPVAAGARDGAGRGR
ncbi:transglutaminase-like domain-containing protein [Cellulomonas sp. S1-8]|uniref:transglutaminase-like domain-containing protein n=1 Tax=Cellulomonas sp. S1-8 TaxID=2904790 RepID=UPI002243CDB7|nr:transglutaminase-like domain-containing protein [Cellulomonas sp. S1-8]UZN02544.1 transglutaminase-like domain-containing protein [Cellulomonas sp. S1-8]